MNLFENPLSSPEFLPVAIRLAILFAIGAAIIIPVSFHVKPSMKTELIQRYRSWAIIAPIFLVSVFCGTLPAAIVFGLILFQAVKEFAQITDLPRPYRLALVAMIPLSIAIVASGITPTILPAIYLFAFVAIAIRQNDSKGLQPLMTALFGSIWLIFLMMHAQMLRTSEHGELLLCLTGTAIALADIGSFICGKILLKTPLGKFPPIAGSISPNKTIPGYLGGFAGVAIAVALFFTRLSDFPLPFVIALLALPVAAALGDLGESLFKRNYAVKESSDFIPGHGGVLDRIDSFIPAVVFVYYLNLIF